MSLLPAMSIFAAVLALATAAHAATSTAQDSITGRPVDDDIGSITGKTAPAEPLAVHVDGDICGAAVPYVPQEGVEYRSGVDAGGGHTVVPADLPNRNGIRASERVDIPLSYDLGHQLGLPRGGHADAFVGVATADRGHLSFNGHGLDEVGDAEIAAACAAARKGR